MSEPQVVTDSSQLGPPAVQECDMCSRTTEDGCIRRLRVDLIGENNQVLVQVSLIHHFFCSETCARAAGTALMEEINTGEDPEIVPDLKQQWRGRVQRVFCHYTSVKRSAS